MDKKPVRFVRRARVAGALALTLSLGAGLVGGCGGGVLAGGAAATAQAAGAPTLIGHLAPSRIARMGEDGVGQGGRGESSTGEGNSRQGGTGQNGIGQDGSGRGAGVHSLYPRGYPMVALGDSTMAFAPTQPHANNFGSCAHYTETWPQQVSQALRLPLADLSCAQEKTASYWTKKLDTVLGPDTKLVVLTYGSNDLRVVFQLINDNAKPGTGPRMQGRSRQEVENSLVRILWDVRKRAPNAMILTVGYLPLVQELKCHNLPNMTLSEMTRVRRLREDADRALSDSTQRVAQLSEQQWRHSGRLVITPGIYNVPLRYVYGRGLCAKKSQRFILNGERAGMRYHYTSKGVSYIARRVVLKYWSERFMWRYQASVVTR